MALVGRAHVRALVAGVCCLAVAVSTACSAPAHVVHPAIAAPNAAIAGPAVVVTPTTTSTTLPPPPAVSPPLLPSPAPVIHRVTTDEPVVFVTIDDGWDRDPAALTFLQSRHWPVTAFLIADAAARDPGYFHALEQAGATTEDHTVDHPHLAGMAAVDQVREICEARDRLAFLAGHPLRLLRPPYGAFDDVTREATSLCGLDALVGWNAEMANGHLQVIGGRLRPGNIVLMHFHSDLGANLTALEGILADLHLRVGRLEDFIPTSAPGSS